MSKQRRSTKLHSVWILLSLAAPPCQESNPDFDGAVSTSGATSETSADGGSQTTQTTQTSNGETTSSVADSGGTSTSTTGPTSGVADSGSTNSTGGGMGSDSGTTGCQMCGTDECVDVMTDDMHCGECDNDCPGMQMCVMGDCMN